MKADVLLVCIGLCLGLIVAQVARQKPRVRRARPSIVLLHQHDPSCRLDTALWTQWQLPNLPLLYRPAEPVLQDYLQRKFPS